MGTAGIVDLPWWGYVLVTLGLTHVTIASVTIFLHRCQAHRALDLHPLASHFFRLWLWLTTGMVTREWAAVHRKHHARCETPEDPHSPQVQGIHRVLWLGVFLYVKEARQPDTLARYGHGTPDDWIERHLYTPLAKLGVVIMLAVDVALFGLVAGPLMWLVQIAWIPFWAAGVINGLGHFWGYRNFACEDASTNLIPWGIFIGGEELHNNHHAYATSARLSSRWYELDLGWAYILMLAALGLARVKKVAPRLRLGAPKAVCDLETLQAVITHRYDVMARYMQSVRQVYAEEWRGFRDSVAHADLPAWQGFSRRLGRDSGSLSQSERDQMDRVLDQSPRLRTLLSMREELNAVWQRSTASSEQLLKQLQDWVARAEASGIQQLQDMALCLRCYAPA